MRQDWEQKQRDKMAQYLRGVRRKLRPHKDETDYSKEIYPGDIVEYNGERFLVGDVNAQGGVCDCCYEFRPYDKEVKRIARIKDMDKWIKTV